MDCCDYIPISAALVGEPALACPVCGGEYVHPVALECASPGTANGLVRINADGVTIDPRRPPEGRGTKITLRFIGECGHGFNYVLHFDKGLTTVSRSMRKLPRDSKRPDTIWRS